MESTSNNAEGSVPGSSSSLPLSGSIASGDLVRDDPPVGVSSSEGYETPQDNVSVGSGDVRHDHPKLTNLPKKASASTSEAEEGKQPEEVESDNPSLASMDVGSLSSMSRDQEEVSGEVSVGGGGGGGGGGEGSGGGGGGGGDGVVDMTTPFQDPQYPGEVVDELEYIQKHTETVTSAVRKLKVGEKASTLAKSLSGITKEEVLCTDGQESPMEDRSWRAHEKHFFIFSSAGKPIYSRYGDEAGLAGLMAVMQAMMSIVKSQGDSVRALLWDNAKVVFCARGPIILVAMSRAGECTTWVQKQLEYLYNQLLSLTTGALLRVLKANPAQDIRNLLKGSSTLMSGLIDGFSTDPGYLVEAHCPLRLLPEVRSLTSDALQTAVKDCHAKCGMLLCGGRLVSLIQDPWSPIHVQDMLLLQNFVLSNPLYREQGGVEFNAPICMPHLHQTAFLHAYIYYLEAGPPGIVVILLMTQPDAFHLASNARAKMEETLHSSGALHTLKGTQALDPFTGQIQISELPLAAGGGKWGSSPIIYFAFRLNSKICPQYVSLELAPQEGTSVQRHLLQAISKAHSPMAEGFSSEPGFQVLWCLDSNYALLAHQDPQYGLFLICDPLTPRDTALKISKELARYLCGQQMREELFVSQKISS